MTEHVESLREHADRVGQEPTHMNPGPQCNTGLYMQAMDEAVRDRAERADPGTARLVNARDHEAAGGRFTIADSQQLLIDALRQRAAARTVQNAGLTDDSMWGRGRGREIGD